ncbi:MAG: class I SAM-dependent methyltransferase [Candidatus Pacebacteria bacterium]|nr:class I SAM-dependent methyltransferase [Candidatus Paceibacterota bacterium]
MKLLVTDTPNLAGWKKIEVKNIEQFQANTSCICCLGRLETLATIQDPKHSLRIGCCDSCGFVTLIDKPSHQWIIDFYAKTWNVEEGQKKFANAEHKESRLAPILEKLQIKKDTPILEIGTGRGGNFAAMKKIGYTNLVGVENSAHRAKGVVDALNIPIYVGGFEEKSVQDSLLSHSPFKMIYTSHVMEHVFDPGQMVELCSKLQSDGDYVMIEVPNVVGEPSMGVLMFLPHLHSFSVRSVSSLLARFGYKVIEDKSTDAEVRLIAQKTTVSPLSPGQGFFKQVKNKLESELMLSELSSKESYYTFARKDNQDTSVQKKVFPISLIQDLFIKYRKNRNRTVVVKKLADSDTIDICFPEKLTLFYK